MKVLMVVGVLIAVGGLVWLVYTNNRQPNAKKEPVSLLPMVNPNLTFMDVNGVPRSR